MNTYKYYAVVGLLMLVLAISITILYNITNSEYSNSLSKSENQKENLYFKEKIYTSILNDNISINRDICQILSKDKKLNLSKPILICYFSSLSCDACVKFAIDKLNEHFQIQNYGAPLLIISKYHTRMNINTEQYIDIENQRLGLPIEKTNIPFYFLLHEGKSQCVFIPDKLYSDDTDIYLSEIKKRYLSLESIDTAK